MNKNKKGQFGIFMELLTNPFAFVIIWIISTFLFAGTARAFLPETIANIIVIIIFLFFAIMAIVNFGFLVGLIVIVVYLILFFIMAAIIVVVVTSSATQISTGGISGL